MITFPVTGALFVADSPLNQRERYSHVYIGRSGLTIILTAGGCRRGHRVGRAWWGKQPQCRGLRVPTQDGQPCGDELSAPGTGSWRTSRSSPRSPTEEGWPAPG